MRSPAAPRGRVTAAFERRAARAEALADASEAAEEPLRFAAGLYRAQGSLAAAHRAHARRAATHGRLTRTTPNASSRPEASCLGFAASTVRASSPSRRGRGAREDRSRGTRRLLAWWDGDRSCHRGLSLARAAAPLRRGPAPTSRSPRTGSAAGHCPFCGGAPVDRRPPRGSPTATARAASRSAARCVVASGSSTGSLRPLRRGGSGEAARVPERHLPAARIEACETCHRYVKSIDLTRRRARAAGGRRPRVHRDGSVGDARGIHAHRAGAGGALRRTRHAVRGATFFVTSMTTELTPQLMRGKTTAPTTRWATTWNQFLPSPPPLYSGAV